MEKFRKILISNFLFPFFFFAKVVGDTSTEASKLMKREGVRAVPAFHFWKSGNRVDSISGADPTKLEGIITDNL